MPANLWNVTQKAWSFLRSSSLHRKRPKRTKRSKQIGRELSELRENGVAGTLDEAHEHINSFQRLGVSRMYFQVLDEDDLDQVSLLAELIGEFSETGTDD